MADWAEFLKTFQGDKSLRKLAKETGISKTTLAKLGAGREPRLPTLRRLARAFPEHQDYLFLFLREIVLDTGIDAYKNAAH